MSYLRIGFAFVAHRLVCACIKSRRLEKRVAQLGVQSQSRGSKTASLFSGVNDMIPLSTVYPVISKLLGESVASLLRVEFPLENRSRSRLG
jgi:hypothetical protein